MACKVSVNVKDLKSKCPSSFDIAIAKAASKEITIDLAKLIKEPKAFADVLCYSIDGLASSPHSMNMVIDLYKKSVRSPELDKVISTKIISQIEAIGARGYRGRYKHGKEIPKILEKCVDIFDVKDKKRLLATIFKKHEQFYPYARKMLATTASSIVSDDSDRLNVLATFYKVMEKDAFFNIIDEIPGGIAHESIQKILGKTKKFNVCKYTEQEIKASRNKKIELLKDIARSPSGAKNLPFRVNFTLKDLENLAPVMRFELLKWYYKGRFRAASYCYNRPQNFQNRYKRMISTSPTTNIGFPVFKDAELKKLLFSVGLKKNQEAASFVKAYNAYNKIKSGSLMTRQDAREAFGREYGYYYY